MIRKITLNITEEEFWAVAITLLEATVNLNTKSLDGDEFAHEQLEDIVSFLDVFVHALNEMERNAE